MGRLQPLCIKTKSCKYYAAGKCKKGHSCNFAHSLAELLPRPECLVKKAAAREAHGHNVPFPTGVVSQPDRVGGIDIMGDFQHLPNQHVGPHIGMPLTFEEGQQKQMFGTHIAPVGCGLGGQFQAAHAFAPLFQRGIANVGLGHGIPSTDSSSHLLPNMGVSQLPPQGQGLSLPPQGFGWQAFGMQPTIPACEPSICAMIARFNNQLSPAGTVPSNPDFGLRAPPVDDDEISKNLQSQGEGDSEDDVQQGKTRLNKFHKTQLCVFHQMGKCKKRNTCRFAHGLEELRPLPDLYRTKLCPAVIAGVPCNDELCRYAHSAEELRHYQAELDEQESDVDSNGKGQQQPPPPESSPTPVYLDSAWCQSPQQQQQLQPREEGALAPFAPQAFPWSMPWESSAGEARRLPDASMAPGFLQAEPQAEATVHRGGRGLLGARRVEPEEANVEPVVQKTVGRLGVKNTFLTFEESSPEEALCLLPRSRTLPTPPTLLGVGEFGVGEQVCTEPAIVRGIQDAAPNPIFGYGDPRREACSTFLGLGVGGLQATLATSQDESLAEAQTDPSPRVQRLRVKNTFFTVEDKESVVPRSRTLPCPENNGAGVPRLPRRTSFSDEPSESCASSPSRRAGAPWLPRRTSFSDEPSESFERTFFSQVSGPPHSASSCSSGLPVLEPVHVDVADKDARELCQKQAPDSSAVPLVPRSSRLCLKSTSLEDKANCVKPLPRARTLPLPALVSIDEQVEEHRQSFAEAPPGWPGATGGLDELFVKEGLDKLRPAFVHRSQGAPGLERSRLLKKNSLSSCDSDFMEFVELSAQNVDHFSRSSSSNKSEFSVPEAGKTGDASMLWIDSALQGTETRQKASQIACSGPLTAEGDEDTVTVRRRLKVKNTFLTVEEPSEQEGFMPRSRTLPVPSTVELEELSVSSMSPMHIRGEFAAQHAPAPSASSTPMPTWWQRSQPGNAAGPSEMMRC